MFLWAVPVLAYNNVKSFSHPQLLEHNIICCIATCASDHSVLLGEVGGSCLTCVPGSKGEKGTVGKTGLSGITGRPGKDGAVGLPGSLGDDGLSGLSGRIGMPVSPCPSNNITFKNVYQIIRICYK